MKYTMKAEYMAYNSGMYITYIDAICYLVKIIGFYK